jgi:hypothetical protein
VFILDYGYSEVCDDEELFKKRDDALEKQTVQTKDNVCNEDDKT